MFRDASWKCLTQVGYARFADTYFALLHTFGQSVAKIHRVESIYEIHSSFSIVFSRQIFTSKFSLYLKYHSVRDR